MALIPGMENINFFPYVGKITYWLGYILVGVVIGTICFVVISLRSYKIKAFVVPVYGSGKDGIFSIGKPKKNYFRWVNKKTAWKSMFPLFNKKIHQPFESDMIYEGNRVYTAKLGDEFIPMQIRIDNEGKLKAELKTIPSYLRNWEIMTHQKLDQELQSENNWEQYKHLIFVLGTAVVCLAMVGFTVYFTFKFAGGGADRISGLTTAIQNFGENYGGNLAPK